MSSLPWILGVVARHAGEKAMLRLVAQRGGTKMKLSARATGPLSAIIGQAAACAVVEEAGQGPWVIPMIHVRGARARRATAAQMLTAGATAQQVALAVDIHERTARRVRHKMKLDPKHPDLFDRD
jgi:hypothetical protein